MMQQDGNTAMPPRGVSQSDNGGGDPIVNFLKELELSDTQMSSLQALVNPGIKWLNF